MNKYSIKKLTPAYKDYIWGGNKLVNYGKASNSNIIAETWELSMHKDGLSTIDGKPLNEFYNKESFGKNISEFDQFPVLVKLIDSADNLSVQVHPDDDYAKTEGQYGKTEMWYIVDAEDGAGIYLGFKKEISHELFKQSVSDGSILEYLNFINVKKGEHYIIPSGTIHAIGKGVTICEIQQNSNLTYRVYDYKRKDKFGNERQLHIDKAIDVTKLGEYACQNIDVQIGNKTLIGASKYFSAYKVSVDGELVFDADENSFECFTCISGQCQIEGNDVSIGDSWFIPAGYGKFVILGNAQFIISSIRKYFIGIDLGGTNIKGGIVDDLGNIIYESKIPTETAMGADRVMDNIALLSKMLLDRTNLTTRDVVGIGMGVPGMIDSLNGIVTFSNNLRWKNLSIADGIKQRVGLNVKIANDANVATLGEAIFGVGNKYSDIIMLTLGTGVGGGIVVNKMLVEGNKSAGAELGHMVIVYNGEQCTCGRRGCLEAYASATALIRETKLAMLLHKDSAMWEIGSVDNVDGKTAFDYANKDAYARTVVDNYIEKLGCGIVNLANIFRPNAVLLGGGVCAQGDNLIRPLQKVVDKEIFAGNLGPQCPIHIARLGNSAGLLGAAALLMDD